jgi:hypothetical protein
MADKHPKPPKPPNNNNAKSIDRWDDEGGAPSGGRSRRKRPRDPAQLAKRMIDIASGEVEDRQFVKPAKPSRKVQPRPFGASKLRQRSNRRAPRSG